MHVSRAAAWVPLRNSHAQRSPARQLKTSLPAEWRAAPVLCMLLAGTSVFANGQWTEEICLESGPAPLLVVKQAEAITAQMFAEIGVEIQWHQGGRYCTARPGETMVISLSTGAPSTLFPGALAYTRPYEGSHIKVFYDRILDLADFWRLSRVLAHVFAHEIAHLLQGVGRHSERGVMKAHWDPRDFQEMSWKLLPFTPQDVELIRRGLEARVSRVAKR